jgi:hypothetical protein
VILPYPTAGGDHRHRGGHRAADRFVALIARLVESSLLEVDEGILEAADTVMGATLQTVWLLPEAAASLILALPRRPSACLVRPPWQERWAAAELATWRSPMAISA